MTPITPQEAQAEEMMKDAAQFSSFAQRVKMAYWKEWEEQRGSEPSGNLCSEKELDHILMHAFNDLNSSLRQLASEVLERVPEEKETPNSVEDDYGNYDDAAYNAKVHGRQQGWNSARQSLLSWAREKKLIE